MARDPRLSERLRDQLRFLDWEDHEDLPAEKRAEAERDRRFVKAIVADIVQSRESLSDGKFKTIELLVLNVPELVAEFLDDYFTRDVLSAVSGYVNRTMQLSRLQASGRASDTTNGYLREAVRTYIFGLPQASVALSRAALEQALKERMALQLSGEFIKFQDLLKEARKWNLLDAEMEQRARDIANAGDDVMHEKPTNLSKALEVLNKLRDVLQHVFSVEGHY